MSRWGRWLIDGGYLTYVPDEGSPDPDYTLETSTLTKLAKVTEWKEHLQQKSWITAEDLVNFAEACQFILDSRSIDELEHDWSVQFLDEYISTLNGDWGLFLNNAAQEDERAFQKYLEWHPSLLPGPYGTPYGRYHGPSLGLVFSQPELPGFRAKRPDFLVLERDSATTYAVLIEIEAPAKRWCTAAGSPSADLTRAIDQLRDWKAWFSDPVNLMQFIQLYDLSDEIETTRLVQHYVLIYGRRVEATHLESFAKKRSDLAGANEFFMTFDRLEPHGLGELTVRLDRSGPERRLKALSVTPKFDLTKDNAEWFVSLRGGREAILAHPLMSENQRTYLLRRLRAAEIYVEKISKLRERRRYWDSG